MGELFSYPVQTPSEFTEYKEHTATHFDYIRARENYFENIEWVLQKIKNRIYINDLYLKSYEMNYGKKYELSDAAKNAYSEY